MKRCLNLNIISYYISLNTYYVKKKIEKFLSTKNISFKFTQKKHIFIIVSLTYLFINCENFHKRRKQFPTNAKTRECMFEQLFSSYDSFHILLKNEQRNAKQTRLIILQQVERVLSIFSKSSSYLSSNEV